MSASRLRIVELFPGLLFNQGDGGNVVALAWRARRRGIEVELGAVGLGDRVPAADIYVIGGAEDEDQAVVAARLATDGTLTGAVADGAVIFGVDAGYEILCRTFPGPDGAPVAGLGLLDVDVTLGEFVDRRAVTRSVPALGLPAMSGYESHRGRASFGPAAVPLAELELGTGNGGQPATDGAIQGNVVGTWLHGPVLPRNAEFADLLLQRAAGGTLSALDEGESRFAALVRDERIAEAHRFRRP